MKEFKDKHKKISILLIFYTVARDPEDAYDLNRGRAYCVDCKITTWPYANRVDSDQYLGCDGVWSDPYGYFTYIVIGLVLAIYDNFQSQMIHSCIYHLHIYIYIYIMYYVCVMII